MKFNDSIHGPISGLKVWEFRVSHGQLLLRRPKGKDLSKNLDVMFYGVEYMELPSKLPEFEFDEPDQSDLAFAENRVGEILKKKRVFVLRGGSRRYIVIAGSVVVTESSMGIFESPLP